MSFVAAHSIEVACWRDTYSVCIPMAFSSMHRGYMYIVGRGSYITLRCMQDTCMARAVMQSSFPLTSSPPSQTTDAADQLLMKERSHLLAIKRSLEAQLRKVQLQLQVLNTTRARLAAIIQERSRVTDLLCHSMSSTVAVCHFSPHRGAAVGQRAKVRATLKGHEEAH